MALTEFQRQLCRLIAANRIAGGESYVAGGVALNAALGAPRVSRDIDLFHDTQAALAATWEADRTLLDGHGYTLEPLRERPTFVEAVVRRGDDVVVVQWVCDSAYRFFPLVEHEDFGLTLHPFDLATNKVLALVGRLEVRDWIDVIASSESIQHLGLLAWAACGKDPGFSPAQILTEAKRSSHYTAAEVALLSFEGSPPDAADLARRWASLLREADQIVELLPEHEAGKCVLGVDRRLLRGGPDDVCRVLETGALAFHAGSIGGVLPSVVRG